MSKRFLEVVDYFIEVFIIVPLLTVMVRWGGRRCEVIILTLATAALVLYNFVWLPAAVPIKCLQVDTDVVEEETICELCRKSKTGAAKDDPLVNLDVRLGRWDASRTVRTFDYATVGNLYAESAGRRVCLATQSTIETFKEILKTMDNWSGPISAAVYVAADEMQLLRGFVTWLYNCRPDSYSSLAIHIATPDELPAKIGTMPYWARNCSAEPLPSGQRSEETVTWRARNSYPQNILRNLARKNCHTKFVYMVDVDIVPCKGMFESLKSFLTVNDCSKCAYVIPTYELDWNVTRFPQSKEELLKLVKKKKAVAYHSKTFSANQHSSDLAKWEAARGKGTKTYVSHNVTNYRLLYEPFYVARDTVPPHDERFVGYGSTRNSQVYEMYILGYQFKVLTPIFTIHWGLQSKIRAKWRVKQIMKNYKKFEVFQKELFARYGRDPLHLFTEKSNGEKKQNSSSKIDKS